MITSATGRAFIEKQEWILRSARCGWDAVRQLYLPYLDYKQFWTFGPGILIGDGKSGPGEYANGRTEEETEALFTAKLAKYEQAVVDCIGADRPQNEFDAWVSFCWNLGVGWMNPTRNSAVRFYLAGNLPACASALLAFDVTAGVHDVGLRKRRQAEGYVMLHPYAADHDHAEPEHVSQHLVAIGDTLVPYDEAAKAWALQFDLTDGLLEEGRRAALDAAFGAEPHTRDDLRPAIARAQDEIEAVQSRTTLPAPEEVDEAPPTPSTHG